MFGYNIWVDVQTDRNREGVFNSLIDMRMPLDFQVSVTIYIRQFQWNKIRRVFHEVGHRGVEPLNADVYKTPDPDRECNAPSDILYLGYYAAENLIFPL